MRAIIGPLAAAFAFTVAAPASALYVPGWEKIDPVVFTGVLDETWGEKSTSFFTSSPGLYRLSWKFDRPLEVNADGEIESIGIFYRLGWVYDDYEGGEWTWGISEIFDYYIDTPSSGHSFIEIPKPEIYNHDEEGHWQTVYWHFLDGFGIYSNNELVSPLGFRITLAQVPEPASWAMMIIGFGLVGLTARRRADRRIPASA